MELPAETPDQVRSFVQDLRSIVEDAGIAVEKGGETGRTWWIAAELADRLVELEWRSDQGFRLYDPDSDGYGDGPIEKFREPRMAAVRTKQYLQNGEFQEAGRWLRTMRELRGLSQEVLAAHLGIRQAAISKIEGRNEVLLSSLREVTEALGGRLEVRARFPDCELSLTPRNKTIV